MFPSLPGAKPCRRGPCGVLLLFVAAGLLASCSKGDPAAGGAQARPGNGGQPALPPVPVAVEPAVTGEIASYYRSTATLEPDKEAEIPARVRGVILQVLAEEGDAVRQGQPLLRIEETEYRLRLRQAEAEEAKQQTRYDRVKRLHPEGLASTEEYSSTEMDLQTAQAARELASLELGYTTVVAPFSGRVTRRFVSAGQTVSANAPLFTLVDPSRLLARVHVPAKEFRDLRTDQPVDLVLDSNGDVLRGRIDLVSPIVDPASGTIKVTVEVRNPPATARPGDFAEIRVVTESRAGATLVPKAAVITDRGERVVFVATDSTAERRVVQVGFEDDTNAQVVDGLRPGEPVVVQGQRSLKHGQRVRLLEKVAFTAGPRG